MGIQKNQKKKLTGPIPGTGKIRREKKTTKDDPFAARDVPATTFLH